MTSSDQALLKQLEPGRSGMSLILGGQGPCHHARCYQARKQHQGEQPAHKRPPPLSTTLIHPHAGHDGLSLRGIFGSWRVHRRTLQKGAELGFVHGASLLIETLPLHQHLMQAEALIANGSQHQCASEHDHLVMSERSFAWCVFKHVVELRCVCPSSSA